MTRIALTFAALLCLSTAAQAQEVTTETLGAATAFDAGALSTQDVSLPSTLWQGVNAGQASVMINAAPARSDDPIVRGLVRAALLSGGVPPQGERDSFEAARMQAVMRLSDKTALDTFLSRNPALGQTPAARVNLALATGDIDGACRVSDAISEGRSKPQWARLRAVCHVARDEQAAAELTRDLLQSSGYEDKAYYALLSKMGGAKVKLPKASPNDDNLIRYMRSEVSDKATLKMAMDPAVNAKTRLAAIWENLGDMTAEQVGAAMSDMAIIDEELAGGTQFDFTSAKSNLTPQGTAQLYLLARRSNAAALAELSARAGEASPRLMSLMQPVILQMPAADQAAANLSLFARAAADRRDIAALQALYGAAEEGSEKQARIALAADALGGGYQGQPLGRDIDARLQSQGLAANRAMRDASLALALGAQLSDAARNTLTDKPFSDGRRLSGGDRVVIWSAANNGSLAELSLHAASALDGARLDTDSLAFLVATLNASGLTEFAGQIAARDFLSGL